MQFLFPGILWALLLLGVPVIIHLFYFRRYKQVLFTNVRFLRELVEETSSRNKIKNLLILLTRLLALASVILAFAQPVLKSFKSRVAGSQLISIFIDNSWSMGGQVQDGSLLNLAKKSARDIVLAHQDQDRFQILNHDLEGKHMRIISKDEAITAIEEIQLGPAAQSLQSIYNKQIQILKRGGNAGQIYHLSDFQKSITDYQTTKLDSAFPLFLIPLQTLEENNIAIDTCYFASPIQLPGQVNALIYKVSNYGKSDASDIRMSYSVNGQEYPANSISVAAGKSIEDTIAVNISQSGWQKLSIKIQDYPIHFDDIYHLSFPMKSDIGVTLIYDGKPPELCSQLLASIPYFKVELQEYRALKYDNFQDQQLIILYQLPEIASGLANALKQAVAEKANVFTIPAPQLSSASYSHLRDVFSIPDLSQFETTRKEASNLNTEADIFQDVFSNIKANVRLPGSQGQYNISPNVYGEKIIQYKDGSVQLMRIPNENNYMYVMACPFDPVYSDYSKSAEISVPLFFKAALSHRYKESYAHLLSNDQIIEWPKKSLGNTELQLRLKGPEEFIPSIRMQGQKLFLEMYDQLKKAGIYDLYNGEELLGSLAFNDGRLESDLRIIPEGELSQQYSPLIQVITAGSGRELSAQIKEQQSGSYWWKYLLIFGIVSLFLEAAIIRYWKSH